MSTLSKQKILQRLDRLKRRRSDEIGGGGGGSAAMIMSNLPQLINDAAAEAQTEELDMHLLVGSKKKTPAEIIAELDERFFLDDFDPLDAVLSDLPEHGPDGSHDDPALLNKLNQMDVVKLCIDKRLSNQVFKNYHLFVDGVHLIGDIKDDLRETSTHCSDARGTLSSVSKDLTLSIFTTLKRSQQAARLLTVQAQLDDIAALMRSEKEIETILRDGEPMDAVSVYKECLSKLAQSSMVKFTCLDDLRKRFLRSAESITARVKEQLLMMCKRFDSNTFHSVVNAMIALGDAKVIPDLLRKYLPQALDELSTASLKPFMNPELLAALDGDVKQKPFKTVCQLLDSERFAAALLSFVSVLYDALSSCMRMHAGITSSLDAGEYAEDVARSLRAAQDVLFDHRQTMWHRIQQQFTTMLSSAVLTPSTSSVDDVLRVVQAGMMFIALGETFSKVNSDGVRGALFRKAKEFAKALRSDCANMVKSALEEDEWKPIHTRHEFRLEKLPELRSAKLRLVMSEWSGGGVAAQNSEGANSGADGADATSSGDAASGAADDAGVEALDGGVGGGAASASSAVSATIASLPAMVGPEFVAVYEQFARGENPMRAVLQQQLDAYEQRDKDEREQHRFGRLHAIIASASSSVASSPLLNVEGTQEALRRANLIASPSESQQRDGQQQHDAQQQQDASTSPQIVLTVSSLAAAKALGRCVAIMETAHPLALDALLTMQEVFDLYVYAVFTMFGISTNEVFTDYSSKYPTLKQCVVGVKTRVEAGTFAAGLFREHARNASADASSAASSSSASSSSSSSTASGTTSSSPSSSSGSSAGSGASASGSSTASSSSSSSSSTTSSAAPATTPTAKGNTFLKHINKQFSAATALSQRLSLGGSSSSGSSGSSSRSSSGNSSASSSTPSSSASSSAQSSSSSSSSSSSVQASSSTSSTSSTSSSGAGALAHPLLVLLNGDVDLGDEKTLFGMVERCEAAESVHPLLAVIEQSQTRMTALLIPSEAAKVVEFVRYARQVANEFGAYMYRNLAPLLLPRYVFHPKIVNVNWKKVVVGDAATATPHAYVASIITTLRAHLLCIRLAGGLPPPILARLWHETLLWLVNVLLEAFSAIKVCSNEGRELMKRDLAHLHTALLELTGLPELPARWQLVVDYANAFYLTADEWVLWVHEYPDIGLQAVINCVQIGCASGMDRKQMKETLLAVSRAWQSVQDEVEQGTWARAGTVFRTSPKQVDVVVEAESSSSGSESADAAADVAKEGDEVDESSASANE